MCSINLNDPLPTIEYEQELSDYLKGPEYRVPSKGEFVTLVNLNYNVDIEHKELGKIKVHISYMNGLVVFSVPCRTRPFMLVKLPSIDKYCFYDIKQSRPIGKILDKDEAQKKCIDMAIRVGRKPSDELLKKYGKYVPGSKTPPKIPVIPPRPGVTKTITKANNATITVKSKPIISNLTWIQFDKKNN